MNTEIDTNIKRIGFNLGERIHTRIKVVAASHGITMQDWMRTALFEQLLISEKEIEKAKSKGSKK